MSVFSLMHQLTDGSTPPFNVVSAALDNEALRKRLMQEMGRRGGNLGGKARAATLSPKQRHDMAKNAAAMRWRTTER